MRPEEYLAIVLRRWWLVLLAGLVAGFVAYAYSRTQPPIYQVSLRLMAVAQPPDYWLDLYAKNRLASYQDLIRNADFVAQALARAGLQDDPGRVLGSLALARNQDSNVLQLVVTDTDPARAARVANALADAFVAQSLAENQRILERFRDPLGQRIQGTVDLIKLDTPGPPSTPIGPRTRLNTAAGFVLGLIFGVLITFVVEYFEDVLRGRWQTVRTLEAPILMEIPKTPRRSNSEERAMTELPVIHDPLSPVAEAYRTLRTTLAAGAGTGTSIRTVLVCGIGNSPHDAPAVAANLAAAFAVAGERILLVDADLRRPTLGKLGRGEPGQSLVEWLLEGATTPPRLTPTPVDNLSLLPAGQLPSATNPADLLTRADPRSLVAQLNSLAERVVVLTAPLPIHGDALTLAPVVDGVLLVVRSGVTPRSAAQQAKEQLARVGARLLGVVLVNR